MILHASVLRAVGMHSILPIVAMIAVTILAALGKITGNDALLVIIASAGIGSTAAASVTGAAVSGQATTDAVKVSHEIIAPTDGSK